MLILQEELLSGEYRHGPYQPFTVFDPKQRRIHKASVRDRMVHQAVVNVIEPLFERRFIYESYSCRVGKGTHAAVRRLRKFLLQASRNHTRTVYILKCDIKKFFASIDHGILIALLRDRICDKQVTAIIDRIIGSFGSNSGSGLPLGNLTSQLFANVYLHELDWFVKHGLKAKYYLRYCDDFVITGESRDHLKELVDLMANFLCFRLALDLHPDKISICSWSQGVDYLGYVLLPHCAVLRTSTARRAVNMVNQENLSSYVGLCRHASAFRLGQLLRNKGGGATS